MHFLYSLVQFLPYWAIPLVLISAELAIHFRRKKALAQWYCVAFGFLMIVLTILWFVYRGDIHSDAWVRFFLKR